VHASLGQGAVPVHKLVGGTHATTWLVAIEGNSDAVLREFPFGDPWVSLEATVLSVLEGFGGLAPRLLAQGVDNQGAWLLLTRLPGNADITSMDPRTVAVELGTALAQVHRVDGHRLAGFRTVYEMTGGGLETLSGPAAATVEARWQDITREPPVLTHYDFWAGNVVWKGDRLSGIVDWSGGALGPRGFDVGWCRLDLYLLYDEHVADVFLDSYVATSGEGFQDAALWDLWALARSDHVETWVPNYGDLGRRDLTARVLRRRHGEWTELTLHRAGR
jgi:aminoglycoside phosphotransferase (APT) family kinase protein